MKLFAFVALSAFASAQCSTDSRGICATALSAIQDNLLGPITPAGSSPWIYGDIMEKAVIDTMAPRGITEIPTLGAALSGTVSWTQANNVITTTANQTAALSGVTYVELAWTTVDGAGTGRALCNIQSVSSTTITCNTNIFAPTSSGVTAYKMSSAVGPSGWDLTSWIPISQPATTWNYYDVAIGLYRYYYRSLNSTYQTYARSYADAQWQWTIDHGYQIQTPRAASMVSQFFRAGEGHSERFPGLYNEITALVGLYGNPAASPNIDNRESGYTLWDIALGAKTDTDATRHTQYCSWLTTYTTTWNSVQSADGSWGENDYALNPSFVAAVKSYTPPFVYQGAPWRQSINVKAMEAAYESLADTSAQGCNQTTLAASTLTTIANAVTWQRNYGRDSVNRGVYYEVNSQSWDQNTTYPGTGTVSISLSSTALVGTGTNWVTASFCGGSTYIGFQTPRTVYKIVSCSDNTHAVITPAYGTLGEGGALSGSAIAFAPAATGTCNSSATYCFGTAGDRNLTRTICGDTGWLYRQTQNATYLGWADECFSATLGGPTAGPTSADTVNMATLPCAGAACDGFVGDTGVGMASCASTSNVPPCENYTDITNLGKNFGEAFGAPGIENELAWRLWFVAPATVQVSQTTIMSGKSVIP